MKNKITTLLIVLFYGVLLTHNAFAGFYIDGNGSGVDYKGSMKSGSKSRAGSTSAKKRTLVSQPKRGNNGLAYGVKTYTIYNGSLKRNVERIVRVSRWGKVEWALPYDYRWVGTSKITGDSVQDVLQKLLAGYPLQAVFYEQNHVIHIQPRPSIAYRSPRQLTQANAKTHNPDEFPGGNS